MTHPHARENWLTVEQLVDKLYSLDPDAVVMVMANDSGMFPITSVYGEEPRIIWQGTTLGYSEEVEVVVLD